MVPYMRYSLYANTMCREIMGEHMGLKYISHCRATYARANPNAQTCIKEDFAHMR